MAGSIEQEYIKREEQDKLRKLFIDKGMSDVQAEETLKKVLKVTEETNKALKNQVRISSDLLTTRVRYHNNTVALVQAENDILDNLERQKKQAEYQYEVTNDDLEKKRELAQVVKEIDRQQREIVAQREEDKKDLTDQQQAYLNMLSAEKARTEALKATKQEHKENLAYYKQEIDLLEKRRKSQGTLSSEDKSRLKELKKGQKESEYILDRLDEKSSSQSGAKGLIGALKGIGDAFQSGMMARSVSEGVDDSKMGKGWENFAGGLINALQNLGNVLDSYVENSAQFIKQNQGQMNAALYGWGGVDNYSDISDRANALSSSALLSQQTYLQTVKSLAQQGIAQGGEVAALLTAVSEKTVPQFNATNSYIRRLVLLGEKEATEKYFGLESILQGALNAQFGESSYLNQLFDSVNSNLTDAIANLADATSINQSYAFSSTVQEWLSTLYEQGVDAATINKMASVLNALGSGNVSAMSSDAGMQKLALLAMDRSGQDYATILQNGLSAGQVDTLLASMVTYLQEVAKGTNNNNVLESAYANLFGISMADMYALRNLDTSKISVDMDNTGTKAISEAEGRLELLSNAAYTPIAEQISNVMSNLAFAFGNNIASDTEGIPDYLLWKGGKLALDFGGALSDIPKVGKVAGLGVQLLGATLMGKAGLGSAIEMVKSIDDNVMTALGGEGNSLTNLFQTVTGTTISGSTTASGTFKSLSSQEAIENAKKAAGENYTITEEDVKAEFEKEDESLTILKEFEETLMQNTEGKKAFAVSLQGMSNEVLKSFASIFADEDSMSDVFKSSDAKNKLFNYGEGPDKTTSNSATPKNPQNNSTTGSSKR